LADGGLDGLGQRGVAAGLGGQGGQDLGEARMGEPVVYRMRYVAILTARDGEIARYRDYWNPLAGAELLGGLDELTAAFAGVEPKA